MLLLGVLAARLARVLGQRLAQHVQALVGAQRQVLQAPAEGFVALLLQRRQPVELLAQFGPALALLLAQRALEQRAGAAQHQHHEQSHGQQQQDGDDDQQGGRFHRHSLGRGRLMARSRRAHGGQ